MKLDKPYTQQELYRNEFTTCSEAGFARAPEAGFARAPESAHKDHFC